MLDLFATLWVPELSHRLARIILNSGFQPRSPRSPHLRLCDACKAEGPAARRGGGKGVSLQGLREPGSRRLSATLRDGDVGLP